jgi:hypothetical protein
MQKKEVEICFLTSLWILKKHPPLLLKAPHKETCVMCVFIYIHIYTSCSHCTIGNLCFRVSSGPWCVCTPKAFAADSNTILRLCICQPRNWLSFLLTKYPVSECICQLVNSLFQKRTWEACSWRSSSGKLKMCVWMYTYILVHTHTYPYIYLYIHICIYVYIWICSIYIHTSIFQLYINFMICI